MREIKTEWRIKKTDLLAMGLFLLVFFLAVLGLDKCLGFSQRISAEKFPWIAAGFVAVSWIVADLYMSFDWAVGFGRTRRQYLLGTVWVYVAGTFLLLLESRFLNEIFPIIAGKYDRIELGIVSGSMVLLKIAAWAVLFYGDRRYMCAGVAPFWHKGCYCTDDVGFSVPWDLEQRFVADSENRKPDGQAAERF